MSSFEKIKGRTLKRIGMRLATCSDFFTEMSHEHSSSVPHAEVGYFQRSAAESNPRLRHKDRKPKADIDVAEPATNHHENLKQSKAMDGLEGQVAVAWVV